MIKRKIDDYIRNYYETNRNALLITGARQIGKTYSIRQFGKTFKSFIEVNFVEMPEAVDLFKGAKSSGGMIFCSVYRQSPPCRSSRVKRSSFSTKYSNVPILLRQLSFWWMTVRIVTS